MNKQNINAIQLKKKTIFFPNLSFIIAIIGPFNGNERLKGQINCTSGLATTPRCLYEYKNLFVPFSHNRGLTSLKTIIYILTLFSTIKSSAH